MVERSYFKPLRVVALLGVIVGAVASLFLTGIPQIAAALLVIAAATVLYFVAAGNRHLQTIQSEPIEAGERQPAQHAPASAERRADRGELRRTFGGAAPEGPGVLLLVERAPREDAADASEAADRDALTLIGRAVRQAIRQGDLIYELEGGTFAVFLIGAPQFEAEKIAERICTAVRDTILLDEALNLAPGAVAIGGTVIASAVEAVDVRKAHQNLVLSRQQGPNSYHIAA